LARATLMEKSTFSHEYRLFLRVLRRVRRREGLTQAELAKRLGQTQSFVSKCERGERRLDIVEVRAFCQALGIGLADFVTEFETGLPEGP
jgi:transcriptional regulator with XRE-family HTH domain